MNGSVDCPTCPHSDKLDAHRLPRVLISFAMLGMQFPDVEHLLGHMHGLLSHMNATESSEVMQAIACFGLPEDRREALAGATQLVPPHRTGHLADTVHRGLSELCPAMVARTVWACGMLGMIDQTHRPLEKKGRANDTKMRMALHFFFQAPADAPVDGAGHRLPEGRGLGRTECAAVCANTGGVLLAGPCRRLCLHGLVAQRGHGGGMHAVRLSPHSAAMYHPLV